MPFQSVASARDIMSLSSDLWIDVQKLVMMTRRSLTTGKGMAGESDAQLGGALDVFTSHVSQFQTEFLHLLIRHANSVSSSLEDLLGRLEKHQNVDVRLINAYSAALGKIENILQHFKSSMFTDMSKNQILAYDAKSLGRKVGREVRTIEGRLRRIRQKQEKLLQQHERALRTGNK